MSPGQCGQMALPDHGKGGCQGGFVSRVHPDSYVGLDRNNPKPLTLNSSAVRIPESVPGRRRRALKIKSTLNSQPYFGSRAPFVCRSTSRCGGRQRRPGGISPEGSARPGRPCPSSNLHVCRRYRDDKKRSIGQDDDDEDEEDEDDGEEEDEDEDDDDSDT